MSPSRFPFSARFLPWALILTLLILPACDSASSGNDQEEFAYPVELLNEWTEAEPGEVGVNADQLQSALTSARQIDRLTSILVVKDGRIIMEDYLNGAEQSDLHDVRSVTKSVVSTIAGIAVSEGLIPSMDTPISPTLDFVMENMPAESQAVTLENLLTMSGGWQYNEWNGGTSYTDWIRSGSTERWPLEQPRTGPGGAQFTYNSASTHLLGVFVEQFLGNTLIQYADQKLFNRIGITRKQWEVLPSGYPNGGAGIDLTTRALARFGQLYLQDGMSGDRRILPEGWVAQATSPKYTWRSSFGPLRGMSYGYLWWTEDNGGDPVYLAWGYGGQFVLVKPSSRVVIVTTTQWQGVSSHPGGEPALAAATMAVVWNQVLPAVE